MFYSVEYTKRAARELRKLDKNIRLRIYDWIDKNLNGCENPRLHGKALAGNLRDQWSYRIGEYRIIVEIHDAEVLVMVVTVGHRREVYER